MLNILHVFNIPYLSEMLRQLMGNLLQLIYFYNVINFYSKHHLFILHYLLSTCSICRPVPGILWFMELLEQCFKK